VIELIIALTAPRRNFGQTVTAVNVASMIAIEKKQVVLVIDTNRNERDMEKYLDNRSISSGLDEFINLLEADLLTERNFKECIVHTKFNIDFMPSCLLNELDENHIKALIETATHFYEYIVFDVDHHLNEVILPSVDVVMMMMAQAFISFEQVEKLKNFYPYKEKLLFVVNRYIDKINGVNVKLNIKNLEKYMRAGHYANVPILPLAYDGALINECNNNMLLNFTHNSMSKIYLKNIMVLMKKIMEFDTVDEGLLCSV